MVPVVGVNATPSLIPLFHEILAPSGFVAVKVIVLPEQTVTFDPAFTVGGTGSVKV